jgi:hypothetical protein
MTVQLKKKITYTVTGRHLELIKQFYAVRAAYQGTWCELFKTKRYFKAMRHSEIIKKRFNAEVGKALEDMGHTKFTWRVKMTGSMKKYDVADKRNQSYEIVIVPRGE